MKKFLKKTWRFFVAFILGFTLSSYGMTIWESILIITAIAVVVEYIIYHNQKKKSKS